MGTVDQTLARLDGLQQRHRVVGFPIAVVKRYGEDHGSWLGAIISYYGFLALLPLLLVFVTVLSIVFDDDPARRDRILNEVWDLLPFVGNDIRESVTPIAGNPLVVRVAVLVALWGAANVMKVCQDTLNRMWGVPRYRRPGFLSKLWRSIAVLALFGIGVFGNAVITGLTLGLGLPRLEVVATGLATFAATTVITLGLYRLLIARRLTVRQLLPGAVIVGVGTYALTLAGGLYVQRVVSNASSLYGSFAAMVGLFAWVALMVQVFVYGTLTNVVLEERLWPRSLTGREFGDGDRRAVDLTARRSVLVAREQLAGAAPAPGDFPLP